MPNRIFKIAACAVVLAAAEAMAAMGYRACHNVAGGFEGPLDDERHRGAAGGWKATGLPWVQG